MSTVCATVAKSRAGRSPVDGLSVFGKVALKVIRVSLRLQKDSPATGDIVMSNVKRNFKG